MKALPSRRPTPMAKGGVGGVAAVAGEPTGQLTGGHRADQLLEVTTSRPSGAVVIGVRGEVDAFTPDRLAAAIHAALQEDTPLWSLT